MELGAELRLAGHPLDISVGEQLGLEGAQPHPLDPLDRAGELDRVDQPQAEVLSVAGEVDAHEHRLPVARLREPLELGAQLVRLFGADRPARGGDDAVGAVALAPVLDLDERAGAFGKLLGAHRLEGLPPLVRADVDNPLPGDAGPLHERGEPFPAARAGDDVRLGQTVGGVGEGLGVAAGQRDDRVRVLRLQMAQHPAGLLVARRGDGAGVDHIDVGRLRMGDDLIASGGKKLLENLRFILVHFAAKGVKSGFHLYTPSKTGIIFMCKLHSIQRRFFQ